MQYLSQIKKFWCKPRIEKILFIKGLFISYFFYLVVSVFPLKYYIKLLKPIPTKSLDNNNLLKYISIIIKTIKRIDRFSLWEVTCLNKSLTTKFLFRHLGLDSEIELILFDKKNGTKGAHASIIVSNAQRIFFDKYLNGTKEYKVTF